MLRGCVRSAMPTWEISVLFLLETHAVLYTSALRASPCTSCAVEARVARLPVPVSSLRQQECERLGDQGRLDFPFDLDRILRFEQQTSLALRFHCQQHHPGADTCSRFHRRHKAHPVEAVIQCLSHALRDNTKLHLHCS